jgi:magnesium-transporting ATPase (P-type)
MGMMLAAEPAEPDIMDRPPRRPGKRLLGKLILWRCCFVSVLLVVLVLGEPAVCCVFEGRGAPSRRVLFTP